jgi:hypothetical protein
MYELSSAVISSQAALQKPAAYSPAATTVDENGKSGKTPTGTLMPPMIPAPAPIANRSPKTHGPLDTAPVTAPKAPTGTGPILMGTLPSAPPLPTPPPIGGLPTTPTTPGGMPGVIGTPGILTPGGDRFLPGSKMPDGGPIKPGMGLGTQPMTAMPSGNVIGARPGTGIIGQLPGGGRTGELPPRRVNPVGGVIGSQPGAGGPMGKGGRGGSRLSGASSRPDSVMGQQARGRRRGENEDHQRWDPDNPWLTDEGVDPVLLPPDDPGPIDPGPVIGRSR